MAPNLPGFTENAAIIVTSEGHFHKYSDDNKFYDVILCILLLTYCNFKSSNTILQIPIRTRDMDCKFGDDSVIYL